MNHQPKSFRKLAAPMVAAVLYFLGFSSAGAWAIHLGPIQNGGNCCTIIFNCYGYVDGIQDAQHLAFHQGGAIAPLGVWPSATGNDFSGQDVPGHPVAFHCTIDNAGPACNQSGSSPDTSVGAGGSATFQGTVGGSVGNCSTNMCLSTNESFSFTYTNQSPVAVMIVAELDGSPLCSSSGGYMIVPPAQTQTLTTPNILVGCGATDGNVTFVPWNYTGWSSCGPGVGTFVPMGSPGGPPYGPTTITGGSGGGTGSGGSSGGGGSGGSGGGTGSPDPTYPSTNPPPITFNPTNSPGTTNPPTDGTMQQGFDALYDAINRNGAANVQMLGVIDSDLRGQQTTLYAMTNLQGQGNGIVGNGFGNETNILKAATNLLAQVTNNLEMQLLLAGNGFYGVSNAIVNSGVTNWLSYEVQSNLANANLLTNAIRGVSNAVVWSGTNTGIFLSNAFYSVMGSLTNLGGGGTNAFSDAGITNAVVGEHEDVTNLLGQLLYAATNEVPNTNEDAIASLLPGSATNQDAALAAGNAAAADAIAGAQSALDGIGSAPPVGDGGMPDLNVSIGEFTLNVSPENIAPGIGPALKAMISVVALLGFAFSAGKLFWEATRTYAQAQTGGVPNLDGEVAGFGGNVLGVAAAVVVPVVFIGIWIAVFTGLIGLMTSRLSQLSGSAFGLPNTLAMNMLQAVFPLDLILSLAWTRVALQFTAGKLVLISASASRYLFGR